MSRTCGLVAPERPCRCAKQVGPSVAAGFIDPQRLVYGAHPVAGRRDPELLRMVAEMDDLEARSVELLRAHPPWAAPESLTQKIRDLLASGRYSGLDA
jgi:hypothetical protein